MARLSKSSMDKDRESLNTPTGDYSMGNAGNDRPRIVGGNIHKKQNSGGGRSQFVSKKVTEQLNKDMVGSSHPSQNGDLKVEVEVNKQPLN